MSFICDISLTKELVFKVEDRKTLTAISFTISYFLIKMLHKTFDNVDIQNLKFEQIIKVVSISNFEARHT